MNAVVATILPAVSSNSPKRSVRIARPAVVQSETTRTRRNACFRVVFMARRYPYRAQESESIATKEEKLEMEGEVMEAFPNGMFKIKLDAGQEVLGYTAGKMRRFRIKIFPGDRVKIELSPYDLTKGRIVYRFK
jgi:translation initiation factor IF-1